MITIYDKSETVFSSLGKGSLIPSSCNVKEQLNGLFELELNHSYDEWGKWRYIENGCIVFASTPRGRQPFRIYNVKPTLKNIEVSARHIFYDLIDNYIQSFSAISQTPQQALSRFKESFNYPVPFSFETTLLGTGNMSVANINPVGALLSTEDEVGSFVSIFGGELLRDNFNVTFKPSIGSDRGVSIRYSKNLIGLEVEEDISDVCTRVFPIGKDGLKGDPVDSQYINDYPFPKAREFENSELTSKAQLDEFAQSLFQDGVDLPMLNIKADFQLLSKTEEYKNFAILEDVQLGDVVTVHNKKMGFSKKASIISYDWDCLLNKYIGVELGDFAPNIVNSITNGQRSYAVAVGASTEAKQILNQISGNITIANDMLYISIDNKDYKQSARLFRWSNQGLQHSGTGYQGAYKTLIDPDGNFII